ncbi:MAG: peptidylprolyl isomerase, partial [Chloracidobacterium sp.]
MRSFQVGCLALGLMVSVACGGAPPEKPETEDKAAKPTKPAPKPCDPQDLIPVKPETVPESLEVQHILIAYKGSGAAKSPQINVTRSKEEARKLWEKVFQEARNCADFNKLVIEYSDDPYKMNDSKYNA